jgi:hypothetical protein
LFYTKGWASILSSLFLYITLGLLIVFIIRLFRPRFISQKDYTNFKLLLFSSLFFLFMGELTLRYVFKIGLSYKEKCGSSFYVSPFISNQNRLDKVIITNVPNSKKGKGKQEFSYTHQYNHLGLRERDIQFASKDSQDFHIIGIGDSFTEGTGTHQDSTWLRNLERRLNTSSNSKQVLTINGGVAGSDPIFDYKRLTEILLPYQPDLVVLAINSSDLLDVSIRGGLDRYEKQTALRNQPWWEPFFASSLIFRGVMHVVFDYNLDLIKPSEKAKIHEKAAHDIIDVLSQQIALAEQHDYKLLLVLHPLRKEIEKQTSDMDIVYKHFKDKEGISQLNMLNAFLENGVNEKNCNIFYWPIDGHHTPKGYDLWAKIVKGFITENNLIEEGK